VESTKDILIAGQAAASPEDRLIVALDFPSSNEALGLVERLDGACKWFKVGLELYYATGNAFIDTLRSKGFEVFLDLKLHDIPNTVAGGVRSVGGIGASLLTVHAGGGRVMLEAAAEAARAPGAPRLLAVTVLTSMDAGELVGVGVTASPADQVMRLAKLARASGIDGMVCSAEEVGMLRSALGDEVLLVTPGIRSASDEVGDQRRVVTPARAIAAGSSMLVVGRPITKASDPAAAANRVLEEIRSATPLPPVFAQSIQK
jgi:orotidine-5'-phosphate decarboxylase